MAFHIIKGTRPNPQQQAVDEPMGYAESFFSGAGDTLADMLNTYAKNKAHEVGSRYSSSPASQRLQALKVPKEQADFLEQLSPEQQLSVMQMLGAQQQQPQQQQAQQPQAPGTSAQEPSFLQKIAKAAPTKRTATEQAKINSTNKEYLSKLDKRAENAAMERGLAEEMLDLLDTGKVESGLLGQYTPGFLLNEESQLFDAKSNELATALASRGGGTVSKFRLQLAQSMKAGLRHKPKAQRKLLEDVLKTVGDVEKEDILRHQLIEENEGEQPVNIHTLIANKMKQLGKAEPITEQEQDILPNPGEYKENAVIEDEETGNKYKMVSRQWFRLESK